MKKNRTAPSLAQRLDRAASDHDQAVSLFESYAQDLDAAAQDAQDVADEAAAEIARLQEISLGAAQQSTKSAVQAQKIRDLLA